MASPSAPSIAAPPPELLDTPYQIRAAGPEDRAAAWKLQQAAFTLPDEGPGEHPGLKDELRVVVHRGKVVSCLTLIHTEICVSGTPLAMGGIRHVATAPDEQNRGYASALMRDTLRQMRRQGLLTSILFPFSFRYYRKFGYELGGNHCHYWCRPNCIPAFTDHRGCRRAQPEDVPDLARLYDSRIATAGCSLVRPSTRWRRLLSDPSLQVIVAGAPGIEGYLIAQDTRDTYGGRLLKIVDLLASGPAAWRALLGWLARYPAESIEWFASCTELAESRLLRSPAPLREGFKPRGIATVRPMFQFRVVDVPAVLRGRLPQMPEGNYRLGLKVRDDLIPENSEPITLQSSGDQRTLRPLRPSDPYLELDIQTFSQLFCGFITPTEALAQGMGRCSSPAAAELADRLFATGEPFICEMDRF